VFRNLFFVAEGDRFNSVGRNPTKLFKLNFLTFRNSSFLSAKNHACAGTAERRRFVKKLSLQDI
jgi:hypothetical protein